MCSNQQHLRRSKEPHSYTFSCKLAAIKNDHVFKDYVQRHLQHHVLQVPLRTYALQIASLFLSQRNNISLYWYFQKNVFLHPYRILGLNLYFRSWKSEWVSQAKYLLPVCLLCLGPAQRFWEGRNKQSPYSKIYLYLKAATIFFLLFLIIITLIVSSYLRVFIYCKLWAQIGFILWKSQNFILLP